MESFWIWKIRKLSTSYKQKIKSNRDNIIRLTVIVVVGLLTYGIVNMYSSIIIWYNANSDVVDQIFGMCYLYVTLAALASLIVLMMRSITH